MIPGAKDLVIGIVGSGTVSRTTYARTLPRTPGIRVGMVADLNARAAQELAARLGASPVTVEAIAERADAVMIATPPSTHAALVRTMLRPGRLVFCEKPFVPTIREARELVMEADSVGARLVVGHYRRTFAGARLAREYIAGGTLGSVRAIHVVEGGRFAWETQSNYVTTDPFGGVLFDTGSHSVDLALFAAGLDESVDEAVVRRVTRDRPEPSHDVRAELDLQCAGSPVHMTIALSRREVLANRIRIALANGIVEVPVGMRAAIRVTGATGSSVIRSEPHPAETMEAFIAQWRAVFGASNAWRTFSAHRFLGVTAILESVARANASEAL